MSGAYTSETSESFFVSSSSSSLTFLFRFVPPPRVLPPRPLGLPPRLPLVPPRPLPVPFPRLRAGVTGGTTASSAMGVSFGSLFTFAALVVAALPPLPLLPPVLGLGFTLGTVAGTSMSRDVTIWLSTDSLAASHAGVFGAVLAFVVFETRERSEFAGGEKDGTAPEVEAGVSVD